MSATATTTPENIQEFWDHADFYGTLKGTKALDDELKLELKQHWLAEIHRWKTFISMPTLSEIKNLREKKRKVTLFKANQLNLAILTELVSYIKTTPSLLAINLALIWFILINL